MLNTNFFHNAINVVIAVLSGLSAFLLATGCTTSANGELDCSASWINPGWAAAIVAALSVVKLIMNMVRDGLPGMVKVQPPVADSVKTVVVATPADAKVTVTKGK